MKKISLIICLSLLFTLLSAFDNFAFEGMEEKNHFTVQERINTLVTDYSSTTNNSVNYNFSLNLEELPSFEEILNENNLPALIKTFALPAKTASVSINKMQTAVYTKEGQFLRIKDFIREDKIFLEKDFYFNEMRGFSVFIDLFTIENNEIHIIKNANITLNGSGNIDTIEEISEAFISSYRALANNFDSSYLIDLQYKKPSMMILSHEMLGVHPELNNYIKWKKSIGFDIHIVNKEDAGTNPTNEQLRQLLISRYNALENKPDYLLIIGTSREGSIFRIPTFQYESPRPNIFDATDLPYSLLVGDDFFPEVLVGRISISLNNDLNSILWKTRYYEMHNFENTNNWMTKGVTVAANYSDGGLQPTTPILMSRWIAEKMLAHGYTQVDTLFHRPVNGATANDITNSLNQGAQIVTYRGWGAANGWHYPAFYTPQLAQTNNGGKLPIVYSIVCDTGDFHHPSYNPSFGEYWMSMGSPGQANGAVAFVGPTYLHTSTEYNNSIGSGMMYGVFDENIRIFGASVMRGKIEMYNNYPRELNFNGIIHFYWGTYNMISDPSLNMWVRVPGTIAVNLPDQVSAHENAIVINAENIALGYVTASRNGEDYTYARIVNGQAILPLPNTDSGQNYRVTIYSRNFRPVIKIINIDNDATGIGLINNQVIDGNFNAGHSSTIQLTVKNFGTETVNNIETTLSSVSPYINISSANASIASIAAGETANIQFTLSLTNDCPDDLDIPMNLHITPSNQNAKFSMISGGYRFEIISATPQNAQQNIGPGQSGTVNLTIANPGNLPAENITGTVVVLTDAAQVTQSQLNVGTIPAGGQATASFDLSVAQDCFVGRNARFYIDFVKDEIVVSRSYFNMVFGVVDQSAPTGPDEYGYYAYDINDTAYGDLAPVYNWIEINPDLGGQGTIIHLSDDDTEVVDLPFDFKYYGNTHNRLSICSNGWVAFGDTYMVDFRNWNIPSALGPYNMAAVFFNDLKGERVGEEFLDMEIKYWHDSANNRFIVQWDDAFFSSDSNQELGHIEFQLILEPRGSEDGDLIFQYKHIFNSSPNTNFTTIGIENPTQSDGVCYSFSNYYPDSATPIHNGLAIRFTTRPPDNYTSINDNNHLTKPVKLYQNYPNPFNPETNIAFDLKENSLVNLSVYNIKGQKVKTLVNDMLNSGNHVITWNGMNEQNESVTSGIYFYVLELNNSDKIVKKMIMLK